MAYSFGEMMGKVKNLKLQKNVMRLISNARRDTSCRILFKTLNILPLSCVYIYIYIYIYNGHCILHKNDHKWVRAELS